MVHRLAKKAGNGKSTVQILPQQLKFYFVENCGETPRMDFLQMERNRRETRLHCFLLFFKGAPYPNELNIKVSPPQKKRHQLGNQFRHNFLFGTWPKMAKNISYILSAKYESESCNIIWVLFLLGDKSARFSIQWNMFHTRLFGDSVSLI